MQMTEVSIKHESAERAHVSITTLPIYTVEPVNNCCGMVLEPMLPSPTIATASAQLATASHSSSSDTHSATREDLASYDTYFAT